MGRTFTQRLTHQGLHPRGLHPRGLHPKGTGLAALALALALPLAGAAAARETEPPEPIHLDADSVLADLESKTADYKQIVVSQGATRIQADRAHITGLDENGFEDGRWTFTGNVRIDAEPRGTLRSDEAVVEVRDKRLTTATATGKPAEFQQRRGPTGQLTRGHADLIVYDVTANIVRLTNNAWLDDGRSQISAPLVVYNITQQHMVADSGKGSTKPGVHLTIVPQNSNSSSHSSSPGKSEPKKPKTP
jgi:lipopolysaccharide export system protein LptA